ncbi:MAG: hypothetical protein ACXAAM_05050 [Candidatus Heimdallarchaeaceae archaeon]|jgi:hypothetical protein
MKRKTIYSMLVIIVITGSLIPLQTQAVADTIDWHPSLTNGTVVAWRITEQSLFDPAVPPTLASEKLNLQTAFAFEINDTLPDYYDDAYSTDSPPNFLKLFVDYTEVSFSAIDQETEPALALQYMIIPTSFYSGASGETFNITQFLEHRAALDPNITSISYTITGANYVQVSIYNDFIDSFIITYNNLTGIVSDFFIEDDFGEMSGQLDIWESSLDDYAEPIVNTLNWHPNLVAGTVLSWVVTDLTFEEEHEGYIVMAEQNVTIGGIFEFLYPELLPDDPWNYYNPDSYFNVFYEEEPIRWENITRAQLIVWKTLVSAPSATLYNGTVLSMGEILELRGLLVPEIISTTNTILKPYPLLWDDLESGDGGWLVQYEIHQDSGIVHTLSININGLVNMVLEFSETHSSLLIDGSVNPDYPSDDDGNGTNTIPGFNWFYLFIATPVILLIIRRRRK